MTSINLVNWREKRRIVQNNRFFFMIGLTMFVTILLVFMLDGIIDELIGSNQADVAYLTSEINQVQSQIEQIKDLQAQKDLLLARRQVIEALQDSRPLVVKIFDNIAHVVPAGVVLNELDRKDDTMIIIGTGENNADVADFLKNLQKLRWVNNATLSEIKLGGSKPDARDSNKVNFKIEANIVNLEADVQAAAAKARANKQDATDTTTKPTTTKTSASPRPVVPPKPNNPSAPNPDANTRGLR